MRAFLLELTYADGSKEISDVGSAWHDAYLKALRVKKGKKSLVMVRVWSSSKGVIKKSIINRAKFAKLLKPAIVETSKVEEETQTDESQETETETTESTETPEFSGDEESSSD